MNTITVTDKTNLNANQVSYEQRKADLISEEQEIKRQEKLAKNSPFTEFAQLNLDDINTKRMDKIMKDNPVAFRILLFFMKYMDRYNAVMASYKVLESVFKVSKPTITRAIKYLRDNEHIKVYKSGTSNVYALNDDIAWKSWGTNRQYSAFKNGKYIAEIKTNVILSSEEQDEVEQKLISQKVKARNLNRVQLEEKYEVVKQEQTSQIEGQTHITEIGGKLVNTETGEILETPETKN